MKSRDFTLPAQRSVVPRYLLRRNKLGQLTDDEAAELERLGQLEHMVQLVKARAHLLGEVET